MNIKEAKEQIKNAMIAYFTKDETGDYIIPTEKQRPVFLVGPPGIGKTAIMEQIAAEMNLGLLSYSMTHHTRQSALGLPFIQNKVYQGEEYSISEYTMSEIIASVYDLMEETGVREGILFLDEINCVSETLSPIMLQFLQYKILGRHKIPNGWIVVTAGNPPEYNNSVREFDIVTLDRLKRIDVEPDYKTWKEYAVQKAVHPTVLTYLEIEKEDFYKVETTIDGKTFVTARGWDDLSQMIKLYEVNDLKVDIKLILQYVQNPKIARNFATYYDLYQKYKSDYQVDKILEGKASAEIKDRANAAEFDERLSLIGMILDAVIRELMGISEQDSTLLELVTLLRDYKVATINSKDGSLKELINIVQNLRKKLSDGKKSGSLSKDAIDKYKNIINFFEEQQPQITDEMGSDEAFKHIKKNFDRKVNDLKKISTEVGTHLSNVFRFIEEVYGDGQEMVIIVTELTSNKYASGFISRYGCKEYFDHNKELLFYERQNEIDEALKELKL